MFDDITIYVAHYSERSYHLLLCTVSASLTLVHISYKKKVLV